MNHERAIYTSIKLLLASFFLASTFLFAQENIPVSTSSQIEGAPKSVLVGENIFIVWNVQSGSSFQLWMKQMRNNGQPVEESTVKFEDTASSAMPFQLVADSKENGFFVAWQSSANNRSRISVMRVTPGGEFAWKEPVRIADNSSNLINPKIESDRNGGCYVVWEQIGVRANQENGNANIVGQRISESGELQWGDGATITNRDEREELGDLVATNNSLIVAWTDFGSNKVLLAAYARANGNAFSQGIVPTNTFSQMRNPQLALELASATDIRNAVIIVWTENVFFTGTNVYAQKISLVDGDMEWGNREDIATDFGTQTNPQIISDLNRGVIIFWQDHSNSDGGIRAKRLNQNGNSTWGNSGLTVAPERAKESSYSISYDGKQGAYITWADDSEGSFDIWAQHANRDGKIDWDESGVLVSPQKLDQIRPYGITATDDRLMMVWQDGRNGNGDIYAQILTQNGEHENVPPEITSTPVEEANPGSIYEYKLEATDYDRHTPISFSITRGPSWLSISNENVVTGEVPLEAADTSEKVDIEAMDASGASSTQEYKISINAIANDPPEFTSEPILIALEDSLYSYSPTATDSDGHEIRISASVLPEWLSFDTTLVQLSGTPENDHVGDTTVVLTVEDELGGTAEQSFTLTVENTNDAPAFVNTVLSDSIYEDDAYSALLEIEDPDVGDTFTFAVLKNNGWLGIDPETGELNGTPLNEHVGRDTFEVKVTDAGGLSDTLDFLIEVLNTNDAPFFESQPIRQAFINTNYQYQVIVKDIDVGDSASVSLDSAPGWLTFSEDSLLLKGVPPFETNEDSVLVRLIATDQNDSTAFQEFYIHISDSPDNAAPAAMLQLNIDQTEWTTTDSFNISWQNPTDEVNLITTLFIKQKTPPGDGSDFTEQIALYSKPGEEVELTYFPDREGAIRLYCWLGDAAGNHDFTTASMIEYKFDKTAPHVFPQPLLPIEWARPDQITFKWVAAEDSISGIANYTITLYKPDSEIIEVEPDTLAGDTLQFVLPIELAGKMLSWEIEATDSVGFSVLSSRLFFDIDDLGPALLHSLSHTLPANEAHQFQALANDGRSGIARVVMHYRQPGGDFNAVNMTPLSTLAETYQVSIPGSEITPSGFEYTIYAEDLAGNRTYFEEPVTGKNYKSVSVQSANNPAPQTRNNAYQIISIPFKPDSTDAMAVFSEMLGDYNDSQWRLLRYSGGNYVELNNEDFGTIEPGQAYWLITKNAQNWQTGAVYSVETDRAFEISVQPGWNLVGNPYLFDVSISDISIPQGVEHAFWSYNDGYELESAALISWQGYFIKNTTESDLTLTIDISSSTGIAKPNSNALWSEAEWAMQLTLTGPNGADNDNFFGSAGNPEKSAKLSLSEPPPSPQGPQLFFIDEAENNAQRASFFKAENKAVMEWEIEANLPKDGVYSIRLNTQKAWPENYTAFIKEGGSQKTNELGGEQNFAFAVKNSEKILKKKFTLYVGTPENIEQELAANKETYLALPKPNPFRPALNQTISFSLFIKEDVATTLNLYNILGQRIWSMPITGIETKQVRSFTWNARDMNGNIVPSGVYFVELIAGEKRLTKKFLIIH